jgi:hypothetical protein
MVAQILSTLNLNRMSCKVCLSAGKLSINDTDDTDDTKDTTVWLSVILSILGLVKLNPFRYKIQDLNNTSIILNPLDNVEILFLKVRGS